MSLQEDLSSSDGKEVIMDMMDNSHGVSPDLSQDSIHNNNHDEKDDEEKYCPNLIKDNEFKEDFLNEAQKKKSENYCDEKQGVMDHGMPRYVEYTQTNTDEQKEEMVRSDTKHVMPDIVQNKPLGTYKYKLPDDLSGNVLIDNNKRDNIFLDENDFVNNFSKNFDNHYDWYDVTITDNFITNAVDDITAVDDHFSTEEDSSVSSGFSEEIVEFMKVDQHCQTDITLQKQVKTLNKLENYQTIFCQMFALLKSENSYK
jgi:hypothetical protein